MGSTKIGILGCGVMGKSILRALIASNRWSWSDIKASVKDDAEKETLRSEFKELDTVLCNQTLIDWADVVILCLKPHILVDSLNSKSFSAASSEKLFISIAAGIKLDFLTEFFGPSIPVIRVMPNVACSVQESMSIICPAGNCPQIMVDLGLKIFGTAGRCRILSENLFDVATAVCGSGPAFFCTIIEGLVAGAVKMGMSVDVAQELATQTMKGTAAMILDGPVHPALLKDRVTTPGGCTVDGLARMESGAIRSILMETIEQCTLKAKAMGEKK